MRSPAFSVQLSEGPSGFNGWVIVAADEAMGWAAAELEWHLHEAGCSTACLTVPDAASPSEIAAKLRQLGEWVQRQHLTTVPVRYSGVGKGAIGAMQAANASSVAGSLIWRGDLAPLSSIPVAAGPTMVLQHADEGRAPRRAGRAAAARLGPQGRHVVLWSATDPVESIRSWTSAVRTGTWPQPASIPVAASLPVAANRGPRLRRMAIPAALIFGGGSILVPAAASAAAVHGTTVAVPQRLGDGVAGKVVAGTASAGSTLTGKKVSRHQRQGDGVSAAATGSISLIDDQGLKYFVNTDITFSTTSSASGAMSEASFTHDVAASTLAGGTVQSELNDAYDGYQTLCISTTGTTGQCQTNNVNWDIYNKNDVAPTLSCDGRQVDFPTQTIGALDVSRQVYVPTDDHFSRFLDQVTNTGGTPETITLATSNNLGSDNNTVITGDSAGNTTPTVTDDWVTTFQNFSGTTTSDPRLGHVMQGPGARDGVTNIFFANGNDNPYWNYIVTVGAGQTIDILNFGIADPTIAASQADAARVDTLPATTRECLTPTQLSDIVNFAAPPSPPIGVSAVAGSASATVSFAPPSSAGGTPITGYTVTASPGGQTATGSTSPITVTGLTPGDTYTFTVVATNAEGNSFASEPSNPVKVFGTLSGGSSTATPDGKGYWVASPTGLVTAGGDALLYGSMSGKHLNAPIVAITATPDGKGYWLVGADGGVFSFGDARYHGSLGSIRLNAPIVGAAASPSGSGYWLVGADGGVFTFGTASFHGSEGGSHLNAPVTDLTPSSDGKGYWLVGADGGVFTFGDASFHGSVAGQHLNAPIIAVTPSSDGKGYWLVGADGGVFTQGDAHFYGSTGTSPPAVPVAGIVRSVDGKGYGLITSAGSIFKFGDSAL